MSGKSFLQGLKNVGKFFISPQFLALGGAVATSAAIPGLGIGLSILQKIAGVEARHMDNKDVTGPQKAALFQADFEDGVTAANIVLAQKGKRMVFDAAKIAAARDAMVTALNLARDAQESMDIVDLPDS